VAVADAPVIVVFEWSGSRGEPHTPRVPPRCCAFEKRTKGDARTALFLREKRRAFLHAFEEKRRRLGSTRERRVGLYSHIPSMLSPDGVQRPLVRGTKSRGIQSRRSESMKRTHADEATRLRGKGRGPSHSRDVHFRGSSRSHGWNFRFGKVTGFVGPPTNTQMAHESQPRQEVTGVKAIVHMIG
jgi:hypothetical protein